MVESKFQSQAGSQGAKYVPGFSSVRSGFGGVIG